jgi:ribosome maturation factor RimP
VADEEMDDLQQMIEERLSRREPDTELIALERPSRDALRLYIDHPSGVDLALCERVTNDLRDLLEAYSLEVSSPGLDRPLTKPEHFRRFLGRRVRVRTMEQIDGRRSFTGTLTAADARSVSVDADGASVEIPLDRVSRSNLVSEPPEVPPT